MKDIFEESILGQFNHIENNQGAPEIESRSSKYSDSLLIYDFFPFTCLLLTRFLFIEKLKNKMLDRYSFYRDVYILTHNKYSGKEFRIEITEIDFNQKIKLVNPYFISASLIFHGVLNIKDGLENIHLEVIPSAPDSDKPPVYKKEKVSQLNVLASNNFELYKPYLNKRLCNIVCPYKRRCMYGT